MIPEGQWKRWKDNSTTDDRLNTYVLSDIRQMLGEIERLNGTLRYIAAQAKAGHAGALRVIQSNAEAALDGSLAKMQAAASRFGEHLNNGER